MSATAAAPGPARQETPFQRFISEYAESKVAVVSFLVVVLIIAVFATTMAARLIPAHAARA